MAGFEPARCGRGLRTGLVLLAIAHAGCIAEDHLARARAVPDAGADAGLRWSHPGFGSGSDRIAVVGAARIVDGTLRLADEIDGQAGAAYLLPAVRITSDSRTEARFTFRIRASARQRSDGLTFLWQSDRRGAAAVGTAGTGLGYARITPSLAVELDIHAQSNGADPSANHVAVLRDGDVTRHLAAAPEPGIDFESAPQVTVWIDYDGPTRTLSVWASEATTRPASPLLTYSVALEEIVGSEAYVGMTAGTGENPAVHEVLDLDVSHR